MDLRLVHPDHRQAAAILGVFVLLSALVWRGCYTTTPVGSESWIVTNRFTGRTWACAPGRACIVSELSAQASVASSGASSPSTSTIPRVRSASEGRPVGPRWEEIEADPKFQSLAPDQKSFVRGQWEKGNRTHTD